ncbi:hypothetical protein I553_0930 [Mycobacterium xenopi 4042]|uniref:Uncharacterized protein n=1 Tax=Mycobacterium xenopi 4042 TaxID=1299334 RepID=X7ZAD0_MYCXE|nr:hypothetical protein I553_0930 [Mycobacterium xenopi 4042]
MGRADRHRSRRPLPRPPHRRRRQTARGSRRGDRLAPRRRATPDRRRRTGRTRLTSLDVHWAASGLLVDPPPTP